MTVTLYCGDCLSVLPSLEEGSVDTIITDPPYGLQFMGKGWDHGVPGVPYWKAALRVAKPGAMLLAFGGTRTHHRLMCAIEDAGWVIRDCLMWIYGSGFPKSHDISKAIDKAAGAEREIVGKNPNCRPDSEGNQSLAMAGKWAAPPITAPATPAAELWDGWGTALKPAWEPIILAMKPIDGTFAHNALTHGVAGLNIDGARIPTSEHLGGGSNSGSVHTLGVMNDDGWQPKIVPYSQPTGRWPANLVLSHSPGCRRVGTRKVKGTNIPGGGSAKRQSGFAMGAKDVVHHASPDGTETIAAWQCVEGCAVKMLGEQSGESSHKRNGQRKGGIWNSKGNGGGISAPGDTGTAARFFLNLPGETRFLYTAKASRKERNAGLEGMEESIRHTLTGDTRPSRKDGQRRNDHTPPKPQVNAHPTVKPIALMRYLCRLTRTPTGGTVLDPFMGSGSTGCAAVMEGRGIVGIELDPESHLIATKRIAAAQAEMVQERLV